MTRTRRERLSEKDMTTFINVMGDAMDLLQSAQFDQRFTPRTANAEIKLDGSLLTATDKAVEAYFRSQLGSMPGFRFKGEEGATAGEGDLLILVDPVDGTAPFVLGMATSTIILAVVHMRRGVIACVIADPATGTIWSTREGMSTMICHRTAQGIISRPTPVSVWNGALSRKAAVFVDFAQAYTQTRLDGRSVQVSTEAQMRSLVSEIIGGSRLLMTGSNGMHYGLIAQGCEYAAGMVTTAIGGPWDIAGVLLVLNAGGFARSFCVDYDDGQLFELADPRQIFSPSIVVAGNSQATVDTLVGWLMFSRH